MTPSPRKARGNKGTKGYPLSRRGGRNRKSAAKNRARLAALNEGGSSCSSSSSRYSSSSGWETASSITSGSDYISNASAVLSGYTRAHVLGDARFMNPYNTIARDYKGTKFASFIAQVDYFGVNTITKVVDGVFRSDDLSDLYRSFRHTERMDLRQGYLAKYVLNRWIRIIKRMVFAIAVANSDFELTPVE